MGDLEKLGDILANSALGKRLLAMKQDGTLLETPSAIEVAKARRLRAWCEAGRCRYTKKDPDKHGEGPEQCEGWWGKVRMRDGEVETYTDGTPVLGWFRCPRHDRWWHEVGQPAARQKKLDEARRNPKAAAAPDDWGKDR